LYFLPWTFLETVELLAALGMLLGVISGLLLFREGHRRMVQAERRMNAAAGEFHEHLLAQFDDWELTPTEKDIALYVIKGFSNLEIANLRGTTESTVKSQVSAIFRKSGVASRQQLATWAVEDLIEALAPSEPPVPALKV
jgi:DNA-binding NarL/FixJ family response regulator